jgi:hypothetical protein
LSLYLYGVDSLPGGNSASSMSFNMNIKFQDLGDPKEIIATTKTPYSLPWDTSSTTAQGSSFKLDFITSETMNRNS